jgi:hypothetical protein
MLRPALVSTLITLALVASSVAAGAPVAHAQSAAALADARAIAKEAYIYGFPLVDSYRVQYAYFVDRGGPVYKAPWNQIFNNARVYTPEDRAIQKPNSDTPYSFVGADLRTEPLVLSVPAVDKGRYYSLQFIDMFTFNFAYVGTRATGGPLPARRAALEGAQALRRQGRHSFGDGFRLRHLSDPAVRSRRHRERQEDPGRLHGAGAVGVPGPGGAAAGAAH